MDDLQWIKDLIRSELTLQETGNVEFKTEFRTPESFKSYTLTYLTELKSRFVATCSAFNQLKGSTSGRIKIYGISKTEADFMVFRNGYKLLFQMKDAGKIVVSIHHAGSNIIPGLNEMNQAEKVIDEDLLIAKWRAFGKVTWTHEDAEIDIDHLVRHYLSRFIRVSTILA